MIISNTHKTRVIDWMLTNTGLALAKETIDKDYVEIIKFSNDVNDYKPLLKEAKENNYVVVWGMKERGERLGYFRD